MGSGMTISTLPMLLLLCVVLLLALVALGSLWLVHQLVTKLMRIFSETQGVSVASMEGKVAEKEPLAEKTRKRMFSMPIPGAEMLREMRK